MTRFYAAARAILSALLHVIFPPRYTGRDNMPAEGPVLIVSNHTSLVDPVFLLCAFKRQITFMAKRELFDVFGLGWLLRRMGAFPVERGESDLSAIRASLSVLSEDGLLGVYPQGHRYKKDENHVLQNGAALIALRSHATVVPVRMNAPLRPFRFMRVDVRQPIDLSDLGRPTLETMNEATERMARAIWPEDYE